ncbi:XRE family transcriptional regulator [Companilactobacillus sp. HBUAS59544]|uniref:XRE family transcriptional regulator n=1 Tax=Companilactobacillus sp. HBUAS59544 TaxID=3109363 RepID=UPI002FEEF2CF
MSIYSAIQHIAGEKSISIYRIENDLNFSNGLIGKWNISDPKATNLQKVADYLGVTTSYILNRAREEDK